MSCMRWNNHLKLWGTYMIKKGNYHYFNFDDHREKFVDIFTQYYGKQYEKTIRERLENFVYVPYMNFNYLNQYFNYYLSTFRNEIIEEYCKLSGRKDLTPEQKDVVWSKGGSTFFALVNEGENLVECDFLGDEKVELLNHRTTVAKSFGIEDEEPYPALVREARYVFQALQKVCENHPCDVFYDMILVL